MALVSCRCLHSKCQDQRRPRLLPVKSSLLLLDIIESALDTISTGSSVRYVCVSARRRCTAFHCICAKAHGVLLPLSLSLTGSGLPLDCRPWGSWSLCHSFLGVLTHTDLRSVVLDRNLGTASGWQLMNTTASSYRSLTSSFSRLVATLRSHSALSCHSLLWSGTWCCHLVMAPSVQDTCTT